MLCAPLAVSGCVIHHVRAYVPDSASAPPTEDAAPASSNCFEASTYAERQICASPHLHDLNRALVQTWQARLAEADFVGRDVLMAAQRSWLIGLESVCRQGSDDCLSDQLVRRTRVLAASGPALPHGPALAQYVRFKSAAGFSGGDRAFCDRMEAGANASIRQMGTVDPARLQGAREIAGTHGQAQAVEGGWAVSVQIRVANAYGGFARRARGVSLDGAEVLNSVALGNLLQKAAENQGGRFSAYASQTGDYGAADVFSLQGRTLALLVDAWGFDAPASPGDFAHAGLWDLTVVPAAPLCLFETFQMPADSDLAALPAFSAWRNALAKVRQSASPAGLGVAFLRDQGQLRAEAEWSLLHMPLLASEQARLGGWTLWLRLRHDEVLDALFAWGQEDAGRKAIFAAIFAQLKPAAQELVQYYQQTQALSGAEAKEAAGLAVMELMYGATVTIAPNLGAARDELARKPRYPILAVPE